MSEIFNKEDVYDNEISPLVRQIINVCNEHNIPMLASFTFEVCEEKGPGRCTTVLNAYENRKDIAISKAAKIINNGGHETFTLAVSK